MVPVASQTTPVFHTGVYTLPDEHVGGIGSHAAAGGGPTRHKIGSHAAAGGGPTRHKIGNRAAAGGGPTRESAFASAGRIFVLLATVASSIVLTPGIVTAEAPTPVEGPWEWYPGEILTPGEIQNRSPDRTITLPYLYPASAGPEQATLRTVVDIPRTDQPYAIKIRYLAAAYRVYVNGTLLTDVGSVEEPIRGQYLPTESLFHADSGRVEIVINVANASHRRVRLNEIEIGTGDTIYRVTMLALIRDAIIFGSFLTLAAYHLILFLISRRDRASLLFAAIAVISAARVGITTERVLVRIIPAIPPEIMMKLGYAPAFLLLPILILYIIRLELFPDIDSFRRPATVVTAAATIFLLVTPLPVYDWVFQYGMPLVGVVALYTVIRIARSPAADNREGIAVLVVGALSVLAAAVHDYLREVDVIPTPELLSTGILVFLVLQAYFLARRFRTSYLRADALAAEVQALNTDLEHRIEVRTRELAHANERLETLSRTDVLTGLANRRNFNDMYLREWNHAVRDERSLTVLMIDVDRFKNYNDRYGHLGGDAALRRIAGVLAEAGQRGTDLVARFGGEEFVVLLPDTEQETAVVIAEKIRNGVASLEIRHEGSPEAGIVTVSVGVCSGVPAPSDLPMKLLSRADECLYRAKDLGRNRVVSE
ncbi:MAG: diguanylate cyclase [Alkalispirochaeta sp.]